MSDVKQDIALSVPPLVVAGAKVFYGYTLPEWAAMVTIVYTGLLTIRLLVRGWRDWMKRGEEDDE